MAGVPTSEAVASAALDWTKVRLARSVDMEASIRCFGAAAARFDAVRGASVMAAAVPARMAANHGSMEQERIAARP